MAARQKQFLDEDSGGDEADASTLKINNEYAARFEHNKKRAELSKLEEKAARQQLDDENDSSSDDEDEDDAAELATAELDDEILATLRAIKEKDPRRLDPNVTFYSEFDGAGEKKAEGKKEEKPMYLQDYHRENYMKGLLPGQEAEDEEEEEEVLPTYQQEQEQLQRQVIGEMHATADAADNGEEEEEGEDDFMVKKSRSRHEDLLPPPLKAEKKKKKTKKITDADIRAADADPETFLSNFMAARAWLPTDTSAASRFAPLESDDSEDDQRAEEFEEAYNLRFEDPAKANEKLASFARDVGKYGVRREAKTSRAKVREREKERKEQLKRELEEDKARLRKLRIEEAEGKVRKIKEAAGLRGKDTSVDLEEWRGVIEGDYDENWEEEMKKRFGEDYYAAGSGDEEGEGSDSDAETAAPKKRKAKKPKWDDDIDIGDILPDFDAGEKPTVSLSDVEEGSDAEDEDEDAGGRVALDEEDENESSEQKKKPKSKKDRAREKSDAKRASRRERLQIESIVDSTLPISTAPTTSGFRYRETSPTSFGLSARDILFASDSQLNEFAGLKKMAAFRDEEKKRRDKKKFGKKARLKAWRRETFKTADGEEPTGGFERVVDKEGGAVEGERTRRWSKKRKAPAGEEEGGEAGGEGEGEKEVGDGEDGGKRKKKRSKKNKA